MTDIQRRQFGNLILMCRAHHSVIDVIRRDEFSINQLQGWKQIRERKRYDILKEVEVPDREDRLQEVLNQAVRLQARELEKQVARFESALEKLAEIDSDAASLIRQRMEVATDLQIAAEGLEHTEDTSALLAAAGDSLAHTEDTAILLMSAAGALENIPDVAEQIERAAANIIAAIEQADGAFDDITELNRVLGERIQELRNLHDDW
jgi:hypothetical protein